MCSGPKWKREIVPDHKVFFSLFIPGIFSQSAQFDFVDTREFTDNGFMMRMKYILAQFSLCQQHSISFFRYLWLYIIVLKSFLVYVSDIFTAITKLTTTSWSTEIFAQCAQYGCVSIPTTTSKWLFVGCIIFSFLLVRIVANYYLGWN